MKQKYKYVLLTAVIIGSLGGFVYKSVHFYSEPTCTMPGICSLCGKENGVPLGHHYGGWNVVMEADCLNDGERERFCSRDGYKQVETIPALGHDWAEATYDTPKTCIRCGETKGHVKGYISGNEITENWSEEKVSLGETNGHYIVLETPLYKVMNITVRYKLYDYTADVSGNWALWTKDSSGNWHNSDSWYFSDCESMTEEQEISFEFASEQDIYGYTFALNEEKNYDWNYNYGVIIDHAQVREE